MIEQKNEQLWEMYSAWKTELYDKFIYEKEQLLQKDQHLYSAPFYAGISKFYDPAKRTLLFVGQEARNWWSDGSDSLWELKRDYSIRYAQSQLGLDVEFEYNKSPFWRLYRKLGAKYNMVWTNIDKVHRISQKNNTPSTLSLTVEDEITLNSPFGDGGKSVFLREVEIIKPDVILFVTGPYYYKTMAKAIGVSDDILYGIIPNKEEPIKEINRMVELADSVFWSYHPGYLSRYGAISEVAVLLNSLTI